MVSVSIHVGYKLMKQANSQLVSFIQQTCDLEQNKVHYDDTYIQCSFPILLLVLLPVYGVFSDGEVIQKKYIYSIKYVR